jgi:hypothetical protein
MSTERVPQDSDVLKDVFGPPGKSPLEDSLLNPLLVDGAKGGVGVARRRLGILLTALMGGEEMHPVMNEDNLRTTLRDELHELDSILEIVERELEEKQKAREATSKGSES